ncbi:DMT family transporter [Maribacter halichondriae]|uniref:DMT family transporter n=1 Tax=Maribacter halichondriae TaxID=2980554 RepID=UPI0023599DB6|nr:DMT family transporter [Maribacter sp. Hal144]
MKKSIAVALLISTMLFWAVNFHVVKIAMEYYSPVGVAAYRFFFGVVSLILIMYFQFGKKMLAFRFTIKELWFMFLTSFFGIFLTIYFFNLGLKSTSAVNGSLIIATSPAITAMFTYFLQKNILSAIQKLAIVISFVGVAIILSKGDLRTLVELRFSIGDIYILGMALVFSLSQVIVSKYLPHVDAIEMTTITSLIALILFGLFALPEFVSSPIPTGLAFWGSILFMGILGTGIAYSAFYYCVVRLGATTSTLYMNLIPLFTVLLAFPFGERIYGIQLVGGLLIVIGLLVFGVSKKR